MKNRTAILLACWLTGGVAAASGSPRTFGSFELFGAGGIEDNLEDDVNDVVNILNSVGVAASASTKTRIGLGGRLGSMFHENQGFEIGGSIGAIIGPQVEQTMHNGPFTYIPTNTTYNYNGKTEIITDTFFLRVLLEASQTVPLSANGALRLAGGLGLATGLVDQSIQTSGSIANVLASGDADDRWTGLAWEFGPSLIFPMDTTELEIGLRYSHFPKKKETDEIAAIKWDPFSAFIGFKFGGSGKPSSAVSGPLPERAVAPPSPPAVPTDQSQKVREFIIAGYSSLTADLSQGSGPHLSSLLDLLEVSESERPAAAKRIRGLSDAYPNISEFADRVIDLFLKKQSSRSLVPVLSPIQFDESNVAQTPVSELRDFFHSLPQGTKVTVVEITNNRKMDVVYDRFDKMNLNMIWCCVKNDPCPKGAGTKAVWLWRVKSAYKQDE